MQPTPHPKTLPEIINSTPLFVSSRSADAAKRKKPLKPSIDIEYLFKRFSRIWDEAWDKKFTADPSGVADEWEDTLAGITDAAIDKGIKKARESFPTWPPRPGEFLKLCQGFEVGVMPRIVITHAADIANKRLQRLYEYKTKAMHFLVNDIYTDLRDKIYHTQNEFCDFAICATNDCNHYAIFDTARLTPWSCVKHGSDHG